MTSFSCLLATDCLEMLAILKEIVEKHSVLSFSTHFYGPFKFPLHFGNATQR